MGDKRFYIPDEWEVLYQKRFPNRGDVSSFFQKKFMEEINSLADKETLEKNISDEQARILESKNKIKFWDSKLKEIIEKEKSNEINQKQEKNNEKIEIREIERKQFERTLQHILNRATGITEKEAKKLARQRRLIETGKLPSVSFRTFIENAGYIWNENANPYKQEEKELEKEIPAV